MELQIQMILFFLYRWWINGCYLYWCCSSIYYDCWVFSSLIQRPKWSRRLGCFTNKIYASCSKSNFYQSWYLNPPLKIWLHSRRHVHKWHNFDNHSQTVHFTQLICFIIKKWKKRSKKILFINARIRNSVINSFVSIYIQIW